MCWSFQFHAARALLGGTRDRGLLIGLTLHSSGSLAGVNAPVIANNRASFVLPHRFGIQVAEEVIAEFLRGDDRRCRICGM